MSTKWTERYNFLRFWGSIISLVVISPLILLAVGTVILLILKAVLS